MGVLLVPPPLCPSLGAVDGPYRTKGRAAALKAQGGKRQRVAASRLNK